MAEDVRSQWVKCISLAIRTVTQSLFVPYCIKTEPLYVEAGGGGGNCEWIAVPSTYPEKKLAIYIYIYLYIYPIYH